MIDKSDDCRVLSQSMIEPDGRDDTAMKIKPQDKSLIVDKANFDNNLKDSLI